MGYELYIDEKRAGMHILGLHLGMGSGQIPAIWIGDGGPPGEDKMHQYSSLEAAFRGEEARVARFVKDGKLSLLMSKEKNGEKK
jgi:hypothetical protein